jgi:hypothetical protein
MLAHTWMLRFYYLIYFQRIPNTWKTPGGHTLTGGVGKNACAAEEKSQGSRKSY